MRWRLDENTGLRRFGSPSTGTLGQRVDRKLHGCCHGDACFMLVTCKRKVKEMCLLPKEAKLNEL